jgi:hypothetical protein
MAEQGVEQGREMTLKVTKGGDGDSVFSGLFLFVFELSLSLFPLLSAAL